MHNLHKHDTENNETSHFNERVEQSLRDKVLALAKAVKDDFISDLNTRAESYGCSNMNQIYGYHISGFIPSQLGGYEVSELYRNDNDTSYHFTRAQSESTDKWAQECLESFSRDNELPEATYEAIEKAGLDNEYSEYENAWFEPALLRFEVWVDDDIKRARLDNDDRDPKSVFMRLSLAYSDAPYYRSSKDDETFYEGSHSIEDFMKHPPEHYITILRGVIEAIK